MVYRNLNSGGFSHPASGIYNFTSQLQHALVIKKVATTFLRQVQFNGTFFFFFKFLGPLAQAGSDGHIGKARCLVRTSHKQHGLSLVTKHR